MSDFHLLFLLFSLQQTTAPVRVWLLQYYQNARAVLQCIMENLVPQPQDTMTSQKVLVVVEMIQIQQLFGPRQVTLLRVMQ